MPSELTIDRGIAVLTLAHGKANALDLDLCVELSSRLAEAHASGAGALILTGRGSIFSAGVDLKRLLAEGESYSDRFLAALVDMFAHLFGLPLPVVAAVNGHAIAGGCVLACAADWRIMARGAGRIGAFELKVGVPFPAAALEIVRFAVPPRELAPIVYRGMTSEPDEALARGLVDELADAAELPAVARTRAEELAALPREAFALAKERIRAEASERIERGTVAQGMEVAELWRAPGTRAAIRRWVERTLGPR